MLSLDLPLLNKNTQSFLNCAQEWMKNTIFYPCFGCLLGTFTPILNCRIFKVGIPTTLLALPWKQTLNMGHM